MINPIIKELIFDKEAIKALYLDNKWFAYTNDIESLYQGIKNSDSYGAYVDNNLVGLVRVISDGNTIAYIQDILILESFQRQKIGTALMKIVLEKYIHCRQILLMTDQTDKTKHFYESLGFVTYESVEGRGFIYKK